jgi:hypothetical protein
MIPRINGGIVMKKQTLINKLDSIRTMLSISDGNVNFVKKELAGVIETLETELLQDDTVFFQGRDCSDLIAEYQRGYIDFGCFVSAVRQRGGGTIAELKEFAEPFRIKEVAYVC